MPKRKAKEDYKPSPYSPVPRKDFDKLHRHVRSVAAYLLGLHIAVFVLSCVVGVLAAHVFAGWTL